MSITNDDVIKIAKLTNLDVAGMEEKLSKMLTETVDYIQVLEELDTKNFSETYQVTNSTNVYQEKDSNSETLDKSAALQNSSDNTQGLFGTKKVIDK